MKEETPSRTALVVAKSQALVGMDPTTSDLVHPESLAFVQRSLRRAGQGWFGAGLGWGWFRGAARAYESLMIPGLALHQVLRKRAIEALVRRELQAGARQVIQVGAGFDALAFRLHREFPQVRFIETDHPATQRVKREVIAELGGGASNLRLCPHDLSAAGGRVLGGLWDPARRAVVIVEGVLMYLERDEVAELFRSLQAGLAPDSRLLFTFMASGRFRRQSPAVNWWLRRAGEPFCSAIPPGKLSALLRETGLRRSEVHSTQAMAERLLPHRAGGRRGKVAEGELLCEAQLARSGPTGPYPVDWRTRCVHDSLLLQPSH